MSKAKPISSRIRDWFAQGHFYDRLFALREHTLAAFQELIYRFHRSGKSRPRKSKPSYRPQGERLETRELLSVTTTWTAGGSDDYWSTSANWDNGVVPLPEMFAVLAA